MKKRFIPALVSLLLLCLSIGCFSACEVEEVDPANFEAPDVSSWITYTISDTERIVLLYDLSMTESGYEICTLWGEWYKDGETQRFFAEPYEEYWGILFSRYGITEYAYIFYSTNGFEVYANYSVNYENVLTHTIRFNCIDRIFETNAGLLNSTEIIMYETGEVKPIQSITVEPAGDEKWNWIELDGWEEFCSYNEKTVYSIEGLNITYTPYRNMGEWVREDKTVPIKLYFYEDIKAVAIYDMSDNGSKLILVANLETVSENELRITSAYGYLGDEQVDLDTLTLKKTDIQ